MTCTDFYTDFAVEIRQRAIDSGVRLTDAVACRHPGVIHCRKAISWYKSRVKQAGE